MPEDHNKNPGDRDDAALDRRQFVKVGATSLGVAGLGARVFGFRYLSPNVQWPTCGRSPTPLSRRYGQIGVVFDDLFHPALPCHPVYR